MIVQGSHEADTPLKWRTYIFFMDKKKDSPIVEYIVDISMRDK